MARVHIAENFNRLRRVHERYNQTTDGFAASTRTSRSHVRVKPHIKICSHLYEPIHSMKKVYWTYCRPKTELYCANFSILILLRVSRRDIQRLLVATEHLPKVQ